MKMYACYQSPLNYTTGDTNIDSYGVDHSNFTTRDEIEYQLYRQEEENRRINKYDKLGLKGNYPQLGKKFWGNPENNYGFGSSHIHNQIEDLKNEQFLREKMMEHNLQECEIDKAEKLKALSAWEKEIGKRSLPYSPIIQYDPDKKAIPSLNFNGEELRWMQNNQIQNAWKAMSGNPDFQCKEYMNIPNRGPIPEGDWIVKQNNLQYYKDIPSWQKKGHTLAQRCGFSGIPLGSWPGGTPSWGEERIWLEPDPKTNTLKRKNLTIHGGREFGSRGCIDLTNMMSEFVKKFKEYGKDIRLNVQYDKNCW